MLISYDDDEPRCNTNPAMKFEKNSAAHSPSLQWKMLRLHMIRCVWCVLSQVSSDVLSVAQEYIIVRVVLEQLMKRQIFSMYLRFGRYVILICIYLHALLG